MGRAKDIRVAPVDGAAARAIVRRYHYSGSVVNNSRLHLGVFIDGRLEGAMQFGPSTDKENMLGLVEGTGWNEFLELNRMAFSDRLPRNSESRALAFALRLIRKSYPHIKWIISFADGTQSGDGTIYRAVGFELTQIRDNKTIRIDPENGEKVHDITALMQGRRREFKTWEPVPGHMLRYIYFLDPSYRDRLSMPVLDYAEIDRRDARMLRGEKLPAREAGDDSDQENSGGATPTRALQP